MVTPSFYRDAWNNDCVEFVGPNGEHFGAFTFAPEASAEARQQFGTQAAALIDRINEM